MNENEVPPKSFLLCPYGEQHYTKDGKYIANFWRRSGNCYSANVTKQKNTFGSVQQGKK